MLMLLVFANVFMVYCDIDGTSICCLTGNKKFYGKIHSNSIFKNKSSHCSSFAKKCLQ